MWEPVPLATGTRTILLIACIGAIALAAVAVRRPLRRPTLARVRAGDAVATQDDLVGTVVAIDGARALVALEHPAAAPPPPPGWARPHAGVWVRSALLAPLARGRSVPPLAGPVQAHAPPGSTAGRDSPSVQAGRAIYAGRMRIAVATFALVAMLTPLAGSVTRSLSTGGFIRPEGEAMQVEAGARGTFDTPPARIVILMRGLPATPAPPRRSPGVRSMVAMPTTGAGSMTARLQRVHHVVDVAPMRLSRDRRSALLAVGVDSGRDEAMSQALAGVRAQLRAAGVDDALLAGGPVFARDVNAQMQHDLHRAELIGVPAALLVLLLVFGSATAALVALSAGAMSLIISLAAIHLVALQTDMSIFVSNIAALLGFGLGIDYSMLLIDRFRRELRAGASVEAATVAACTRAAPAVLVSGVAVATGLLGMFAFDMPALRSIAIGGTVTVLVTMACSVVVLPAILAMLGPAIERGRVRNVGVDGATSPWRRLATAVLRRPAVVLVCVGGLAFVVATSATHAHLEVANPKLLPAHLESRTAEKAIEQTFSVQVTTPILVMVDGPATPVAAGPGHPATTAFEQRLRGLPNVAAVRAAGVHGARRMFVVTARRDSQGGPASRRLVHDIRLLDHTADPGQAAALHVRVGGKPATDLEFFDQMRKGIPLAMLVVLGSTFLVLLVAFRSIVIPVKAIALDVLSICATLGIVVLVSGTGLLGAEAAKQMDASLPLLLFCLLFGLSMDYEVFMLARVTENWQGGMDTDEATTEGLVAVAPLITGAAMILIVLGLSFATTELVLVRQIGFGVATALLIDATVMRGLLVPAAMSLLGDRNWWVPDFLARRIPRPRWA